MSRRAQFMPTSGTWLAMCFHRRQMFGAIKKMFKRGGSGSQDSSANAQSVTEQDPSNSDSSAAESASYSGDEAGETLRVSLKALVAQLPKELQGKNPPASSEALILPKHQVLEQL